MIIGAGPAGSACAIELARFGVGPVLLVEAGAHDRFRIGESVPPEANNPENFEQINVNADIVGDAKAFLKPNERVSCQILDDQVVSFELPFTVELEVKDCPPNVKGATATNQSKEAILETGAKVRVPPFVEIGTLIRVDTRSGEYIERVR